MRKNAGNEFPKNSQYFLSYEILQKALSICRVYLWMLLKKEKLTTKDTKNTKIFF